MDVNAKANTIKILTFAKIEAFIKSSPLTSDKASYGPEIGALSLMYSIWGVPNPFRAQFAVVCLASADSLDSDQSLEEIKTAGKLMSYKTVAKIATKPH